MKAALAAGFVASVTALTAPALAHSRIAQSPDNDRAICDDVFAKLEQQERGLLVAEAETEAKQSKPSEDELAKQLSSMLQACSYEGEALKVDAHALAAATDAGGDKAVGEIMRFTGLPQNFKVMQGDVPNAAALIVINADGVPERVIAYDPAFMKQVRSATEDNDWASISILAHEIGHHLSGHTLVPGGSRPPIELEADKFSGFVLFKMGAKLGDAQKAIATLAPQEDGPTHPGRPKRLTAIESGWTESCQLQQETCDSGTLVVAATPQAQALPEMQPTEAGRPKRPDIPTLVEMMQRDKPLSKNPTFKIDRVPQLDASATPAKFDRFVYDEVGVIHPEVRGKLERLAYEYAAWNNVEIVTIVAEDLQGRTADQYALDAMRQLRVGKMEVGNGAVLVVAPKAKQVGVALGAGLLVQYQSTDSLKSGPQRFVQRVAEGEDPAAYSDLIANFSYGIMNSTKELEWVVRFGSLAEMLAADERFEKDLKSRGGTYNSANDPTHRKFVRLQAKVISKSPDKSNLKLRINEARERHLGPAMLAQTADGRDVIVYVHSSVPTLMTAPLDEGKTYSFTTRNDQLSDFNVGSNATPQLDLISYDLVD